MSAALALALPAAAALALQFFASGRTTAQRWLRRGLAVALCFTAPLFFWAVATSGPDPQDLEAPGSNDYRRAGTVFLTFLGLRAPVGQPLGIGGAATDAYFIDGVPGSVATIDGNGVVHVAATGRAGDAFGAVLGKLRDLGASGSIPTWRLRPGALVCLREGPGRCDEGAAERWRIDGDSQVWALQQRDRPGGASAACKLSDHIAHFRVQRALGRLPNAAARIFPLENFGRPACAGPPLFADVNHAGRRVFWHFDRAGALFVSQLPASDLPTRLVVEGADRVDAAPSAAPGGANGDAGDGATVVTVFRLRSNAARPESVADRAALSPFIRSEFGTSALVPIAEIELARTNRADGASDLTLKPVRPPVVGVPPRDTCSRESAVTLLGSLDRMHLVDPSAAEPAVAAVRVPFITTMADVGAIGASMTIHRAPLDGSPVAGSPCPSFGPAVLGVAGPFDAFGALRGDDLVELGAAASNRRLLVSVAEYRAPVQALLMLVLGTSVLRCIWRRRLVEGLVLGTLVVSVITMLEVALVLRLVVAIQEVALAPSRSQAVVPALLTLLVAPAAFELAVLGWAGVVRHRVRVQPRGAIAPIVAPPASPASSAWRRPRVALQAAAGLCFRPLPLALVAFYGAVVLFGFREQIGGVRMTLLLVPALMIVASAFAIGRGDWPDSYPRAMGVLLLLLVVALLLVAARDTGALIILTGVLIGLAAVHTLKAPPPALRLLETLQAAAGLCSRALPWALVLAYGALVLAGFREQIGGVRMTLLLVPALVMVACAVSIGRGDRPASYPRAVGALLLLLVVALLLAAVRDTGALIILTGVLFGLTAVHTLAAAPPALQLRDRAVSMLFAAAAAALAFAVSAALIAYASGWSWQGAAGRVGMTDVLAAHPALGLLVFGAVLAVAVAAWRWWTPSARVLGAAAAFSVLVVVALSGTRIEVEAVPCSEVGLDIRNVGQCLDSARLDTNRLRLAYLLLPDVSRLEVSGEARNTNAVFDELRWLLGSTHPQGFMAPPDRWGLDHHDNAVATHWIATQGGTAAVALGVVMALPALSMLLTRRHRRWIPRQPLPLVAALVLAFTGIYMLLANSMLVPFTGRNVYLTNPDSWSDMAEGSALVLLMLAPVSMLTRARAALPARSNHAS